MTAPRVIQGFPQSTESVTGEPQGDTGLLKSQQDDASVGKPQAPQGFWLLGEPEKVAKDIDKRWSAQDKGMERRLLRWDVNSKRRDGDPYTKLVKNTDEDSYRVYTPRGIENAPPALNKTDDLAVKMVANLLVDPPKPECEPSSDSDEDRNSAEFSTRVLMNESTESGLNIPDLVEEAEDAACTHASGFVYAYLDPQGGGHRPREIMAPQTAMQVGPNGQPIIPPADTTQPIVRYVGQDGVSIVDDPSQAVREWLPTVCAEVMTGENVRFLPETASSIRDAEGVLIAAFATLGEVKARFKDVAKMGAEDLRKLVSHRPDSTKRLLPKWAGNGEGTKTEDWKPEQGPPDDALVLTISGYMRGSGAYPLGAYAVMGGGKYVLHRREWKEQVRSPRGKMVDRAMDIPVAQFRQFRSSRKSKDPYGRALVELVGDGDPLRAFVLGAVIEYLHRANNPHQFVPIGSGIQPKALQQPRGSLIPYNPAGGGKPQQEDVGQLSPIFMELYRLVTDEMNSRSGLQEAAQGVENANVQSGKHAQQIIEQALVSLSGVKHGMESGYMRLCRIVLQLIRMGYTTPRRLRIVGEDGAYKEREWMGTDLGSTTDVKITAGTSTMLAPSAKSQIALEKLQVGAITPEDFQRAEEGNVRALIGRQDNPHKTRVAGQVSDWNDGPPEGWQPPQIDPATGVALPPPPDPVTGQVPPDANPFADVRPVDEEQAVAIIRHQALSRAVASSKFKAKPPEWQQHLLAAYDQARRAAGIATVAEQQMAMQQQAQMQSEQASADGDRKHQQGMEKQAASADQKSAQEQQRAENQMAAAQMLPPNAPGKQG